MRLSGGKKPVILTNYYNKTVLLLLCDNKCDWNKQKSVIDCFTKIWQYVVSLIYNCGTVALGQFSDICGCGLHISENWPRTIRATVPQLSNIMHWRKQKPQIHWIKYSIIWIRKFNVCIKYLFVNTSISNY